MIRVQITRIRVNEHDILVTLNNNNLFEMNFKSSHIVVPSGEQVYDIM